MYQGFCIAVGEGHSSRSMGIAPGRPHARSRDQSATADVGDALLIDVCDHALNAAQPAHIQAKFGYDQAIERRHEHRWSRPRLAKRAIEARLADLDLAAGIPAQ